jgi:hypothetical protein
MISVSGSTALARLAATKQPVHVADAASEQAYQIDPQRRLFLNLAGVRTNLAVPMLINPMREDFTVNPCEEGSLYQAC